MDSPMKGLREQAGLSAVELAIELKTSTQHVYALEAGTGMQMKTAIKVSRILAKHLRTKPSKVLAELTQVDEKQPVTAA